MARKVLRYGPLEVDNEEPQQVHMPINAAIIKMDSKSKGFVDIWAVVDEDAVEHTTTRTFQVFGTGVPIPEDAQYFETSIQDFLHNGTRVFHVFERLAD